MEGSSLILRRLNPDEAYFSTTIILPMGNYRYTVLPQGTSSSCDIFNIMTDGGIRGVEGHFKNIDDMLTTSSSDGAETQKIARNLSFQKH